jgi:hypothetical protein
VLDADPSTPAQVDVIKQYTVTVRDAAGNASPVTLDRTFSLTATGVVTPGAFYADAGGANVIAQATVVAGQSSVLIYYKPAISGAQELKADDGILTPEPLPILVP